MRPRAALKGAYIIEGAAPSQLDTLKMVAHLKDRNQETKTVCLDKLAKISSHADLTLCALKEISRKGLGLQEN